MQQQQWIANNTVHPQIKTFETLLDGKPIADTVIKIAKSVLEGHKPVWTGVTVDGLIHPDLHFEITVEALLPS